jgi:hypothetical protein
MYASRSLIAKTGVVAKNATKATLRDFKIRPICYALFPHLHQFGFDSPSGARKYALVDTSSSVFAMRAVFFCFITTKNSLMVSVGYKLLTIAWKRLRLLKAVSGT